MRLLCRRKATRLDRTRGDGFDADMTGLASFCFCYVSRILWVLDPKAYITNQHGIVDCRLAEQAIADHMINLPFLRRQPALFTKDLAVLCRPFDNGDADGAGKLASH